MCFPLLFWAPLFYVGTLIAVILPAFYLHRPDAPIVNAYEGTGLFDSTEGNSKTTLQLYLLFMIPAMAALNAGFLYVMHYRHVRRQQYRVEVNEGDNLMFSTAARSLFADKRLRRQLKASKIQPLVLYEGYSGVLPLNRNPTSTLASTSGNAAASSSSFASNKAAPMDMNASVFGINIHLDGGGSPGSPTASGGELTHRHNNSSTSGDGGAALIQSVENAKDWYSVEGNSAPSLLLKRLRGRVRPSDVSGHGPDNGALLPWLAASDVREMVTEAQRINDVSSSIRYEISRKYALVLDDNDMIRDAVRQMNEVKLKRLRRTRDVPHPQRQQPDRAALMGAARGAHSPPFDMDAAIDQGEAGPAASHHQNVGDVLSHNLNNPIKKLVANVRGTMQSNPTPPTATSSNPQPPTVGYNAGRSSPSPSPSRRLARKASGRRRRRAAGGDGDAVEPESPVFPDAFDTREHQQGGGGGDGEEAASALRGVIPALSSHDNTVTSSNDKHNLTALSNTARPANPRAPTAGRSVSRSASRHEEEQRAFSTGAAVVVPPVHAVSTDGNTAPVDTFDAAAIFGRATALVDADREVSEVSSQQPSVGNRGPAAKPAEAELVTPRNKADEQPATPPRRSSVGGNARGSGGLSDQRIASIGRANASNNMNEWIREQQQERGSQRY